MEAPFPIRLISQDVIDQGKELLSQVIAPEEIEYHAKVKARAEMNTFLMEAVFDIIEHPEKASMTLEPRKAVSDQERAELAV